MLRRTMALALAITLVTAAGSAVAQSCLLGLYADAAATDPIANPREGQIFNVYSIIKAESTVNAVSQVVTFPAGVFVAGTPSYGPSGGGLNIVGAGDNIGLGECAIGFGGLPILVATYDCIVPVALPGNTIATIGPNPDEDPNFPVFSDCGGVLHACGNTQDLLIGATVAVEAKSFGSVKSLYNN